jgi:hypothetical protein
MHGSFLVVVLAWFLPFHHTMAELKTVKKTGRSSQFRSLGLRLHGAGLLRWRKLHQRSEALEMRVVELGRILEPKPK